MCFYISAMKIVFKMAIFSNYINIWSNIKNIDRMFLSSIFVRLNLKHALLKMRSRVYYICLFIAIFFNSLITMNILLIQKTVIKLVRTIECFHATMVLYINTWNHSNMTTTFCIWRIQSLPCFWLPFWYLQALLRDNMYWY